VNANNVVQLFAGRGPTRDERVVNGPLVPPLQHAISTLSDNLMDYIEYRAVEEGFQVHTEECEVILLMVSESIRALLSQSIGLEHPVIAFAEDVFNIVAPKVEDESEE
jgi:hypothetical protein